MGLLFTWGCQNHPLARIATSFFGFWGAVDISGHSAAFKGAIFAERIERNISNICHDKEQQLIAIHLLVD